MLKRSTLLEVEIVEDLVAQRKYVGQRHGWAIVAHGSGEDKMQQSTKMVSRSGLLMPQIVGGKQQQPRCCTRLSSQPRDSTQCEEHAASRQQKIRLEEMNSNSIM
jgi:hypothetical protein